MSGVEKLSKVIASKISMNLSIDKDHEEVLAYGAFAFTFYIFCMLVWNLSTRSTKIIEIRIKKGGLILTSF